MPTRKIPEEENSPFSPSFPYPCQDPDHNPPTMQVFDPGLHEHECPRCHRKLKFRVAPIMC